MVCETCQKKLGTVIVPDKWKEGAKNTNESGSSVRSGKNTLLMNKERNRYEPYESRCRICKSKLHQKGAYCTECAYKKGICSMCGRKILDTSGYKQSSK
jgi:hypothetical protein